MSFSLDSAPYKAGRLSRRVQSHSLLALVGLGALFVFIKLHGTPVDRTLWAEDGTVFINQARSLGLSAFWTPYAGYIHLYPRLIAWISSFFGIYLSPLIFFAGWLGAYFALLATIRVGAIKYGLSPLLSLLLSLLIVAQPHSGEVFFTLTNSQWLIGAALSIYLLTADRSDRKPTISRLVLLLVASLTGPYSVILMPVLVLKHFLNPEYRLHKATLFTVGIGASIQILAIALSDRIRDSGGVNRNPFDWITSFVNFATFGATDMGFQVVAIIFWTTLIYAVLARSCRDEAVRHATCKRTAIFLFIAGALFYIGGLAAFKLQPQSLNPMGGGARYFFVPYSLVFFAAAILASGRSELKFILLGTVTMLAGSSYAAFGRENLQFSAYSKFSEVKKDVLIPIHPQWANFPAWHVKDGNLTEHDAGASKEIRAQNLNATQLVNLNFDVEKKLFSATTGDPQIIYDIQGRCPETKTIGVEFILSRSSAGWAQLFWSKSNEFNTRRSLRRYYPEGKTTMHFAFRANAANSIRFDPIEDVGSFQIISAQLYCL